MIPAVRDRQQAPGRAAEPRGTWRYPPRPGACRHPGQWGACSIHRGRCCHQGRQEGSCRLPSNLLISNRPRGGLACTSTRGTAPGSCVPLPCTLQGAVRGGGSATTRGPCPSRVCTGRCQTAAPKARPRPARSPQRGAHPRRPPRPPSAAQTMQEPPRTFTCRWKDRVRCLPGDNLHFGISVPPRH